jgi:spoIIIJ-associated protein
MEYSEKYGLDVDEAVRLALEELCLTEDQVMVTVLEESTKGFLGLGQKLAKVRVEKIAELDDEYTKEDLKQAEAILRDEKKAQSEAKAGHDFRKKPRPQQSSEEQFANRASRPERTDRGERSDRGDRGDHRDRGERGNHGERRDRGERGDRGGSDRGKPRGQSGPRREYQEVEIDLSKIPQITETIENLVEDPENAAAKFLQEILSKMKLEVEVKGSKNEECSFLEVKGPDARMVIGKRGQTLDALQYLTNLVSNRGLETYHRVIIDVEGYRTRREKTLEQLAIKLAKKVLKTGRPARLEPMNPYERKVIHATLQFVDGVSTKSEGEEPYRRVIIERG